MTNMNERESAIIAERISSSIDAITALSGKIEKSVIEVADIIEKIIGKTIVSGSGTSGATARRMAHLLNVTGNPAYFQHPTDALHGSISTVTKQDVLITISKGGGSAEVNKTLELALNLGAFTILITENPKPSAANFCKKIVVLPEIGQPGEPGGMIAMASTLAISTWGDALCVILMSRNGHSFDEVLKSHPYGAVGSSTKKIKGS
ncbi:MAG: SIS domain-containing protein [Actinomycetota bacterium]|nr:SIS domain-containing protein [Actinomycetota bacterium]